MTAKIERVVEAKGIGLSTAGTHVTLHFPVKGGECVKIDLFEGMSKTSRTERCLVAEYVYGLVKDEVDEAKPKKAAKPKKD